MDQVAQQHQQKENGKENGGHDDAHDADGEAKGHGKVEELKEQHQHELGQDDTGSQTADQAEQPQKQRFHPKQAGDVSSLHT